MSETPVTSLIITTIHNQLPPWFGFNAKIPQIVTALKNKLSITILTYGNSEGDLDALRACWPEVTFVPLAPKPYWRSAALAALSTRLRVAAMRDFSREAAVISAIASERPGVRLLVDDLAGVELLPAVQQGAVVSCNDCASDYAYHEFRLAETIGRKLRSLIRMAVFLRYEKRYLHLASAVHVVKRQDGERMLRLNRRINPVEIPLASLGGQPVRSPSPSARSGASSASVLIWGNLQLGLVLGGFKPLVAEWQKSGAAHKLTVLGRVPLVAAQRILGMDQLPFEYHETVPDIDMFLKGFDVVILPDTAGSGQKFRLLDLMRNGKCVAGFPHPFEGMPASDTPYYVAGHSATEIWQQVRALTPSQARAIGDNARRVFDEQFGFDLFSNKWLGLLNSVPPLKMLRS